MIKINFKFILVLIIVSSSIDANDIKAKVKFKPQYPKSAYAKRISGYAVVEYIINENCSTEKQNIKSAKCFNLIDKNGKYFWYDFRIENITTEYSSALETMATSPPCPSRPP